MAPKSATIILAVLSVLAVAVPIIAAAAAAPRSPRVGAYQPIENPNTDLNVVSVAKWAVAAHNKAMKTSLVFVSVVKGEWQVVEGVNFRLVISAKDGAAPTAAPKTYTAVVYKEVRGAPKLISFA